MENNNYDMRTSIKTDIEDGNKPKKKSAMKIIIGIAAAAVIICAVAVIASKLMVSVEDLCAEGKYIEAYKKAKAEEKMDVLSENVIAVLSQESSDLLKDPSSLVLRNAWYYPFLRNDGEIGGRVVLQISAANSYGGIVASYHSYVLQRDGGGWSFCGDNYTLELNDSDELNDKFLKLGARIAIENGHELSKMQLERINSQFKAGTLCKVKEIDWNIVDTSSFPVIDALN